MSSKSAKEYGAQGRSDVFMIDPRKVVIEEDSPNHKDYHAHEPRRVMQPRLLRLIRTRGAAALGEVRVKKVKRDDGSTYVRAIDGRVRIRHARAVLVEKLTEMGVDPETWEPSENDPTPLLVRAVPEQNDDATIFLNAYQKRDPPLMLAQVCDEKRENNMPIEDIGLLINRSRSAVEKYLKLWDDGCDELKEALHADRVTFNAALRLCDRSHDKQREALAKLGERGKKLRGQAAEAVARGDEPDARPRFRAPAAKLAEEVEKLPNGPARTVLEWVLGRSTVLTVEPHETISEIAEKASEHPPFTGGAASAAYHDGRDPDDVKEIDELKQEFEKLRAERDKIAAGNAAAEASLRAEVGAQRERVKELESEVAKLRTLADDSVAIADLRTHLDRLRVLEEENAKLRAALADPQGELLLAEVADEKPSLDEDVEEFTFDLVEIVGKVVGDLLDEEKLDDRGYQIAASAARAALKMASDRVSSKIDEINTRAKDLDDLKEEVADREADLDQAEEDQWQRDNPPPTDEERRAAMASEVRFCAARGRLPELLAKKPAMREIAHNLGFEGYVSPFLIDGER